MAARHFHKKYIGGALQTLELHTCLLYTSDAADDLLCVDLGGRRIIKKKIWKSAQIWFRLVAVSDR